MIRPRSTTAVLACALASIVVLGCKSEQSDRQAADSAQPAAGSAAPAAAASPRTPGDPMAEAGTEMRAVLEQHAALGPKPIETLTPEEARRQPTPADAVHALLKAQGKPTAPEAVASVVNRTIDGPGGKIPVRIYTPAGPGPFPVILYIHGGGWVIADLDTYDASPRSLANGAQAVVVSTHYRQGPEHKFPAAHEDTWAAYQWVVKNARAIKGDPAKIAVAGESAGGNMAADVAIMARDQNVQLPVYQVLVYPVASGDTATASKREWVNGKPLNTPMMQWFGSHYFRTPADGIDPRINLVGANLRGLPPATIITAEIDPLNSEGKQLADRMRDAGVAVDYKNYDGATHEFFGMGAVVPQARDAMAQAVAGLRKAFGMPAAQAAAPRPAPRAAPAA